VEWSPLALDRVSDIARYIARDNPDAAEQWVAAGSSDDFPDLEDLRDEAQADAERAHL